MMAPSEVVAAVLNLRETEEFPRLAQHLSQEFLQAFQRDRLSWIGRWLLQQLREPAQVGAAESLPSVRMRSIPLAALPNGPTVADLEGLSERDFFSQWAAAAGRAATVLEESPRRRPSRIIGSIDEDGEWAHVLYRYGDVILGPERTCTATLRRDGDKWLLYWLSEPLLDDGPLGRLLAIAG